MVQSKRDFFFTSEGTKGGNSTEAGSPLPSEIFMLKEVEFCNFHMTYMTSFHGFWTIWLF